MAKPTQSSASLGGLIGKIESLTGDVTATAKSTMDRDIVNPSGKVTARLTGAEKMRLRKETRIFWDEYYKIRGRYEKDDKGKTRIAAGKAGEARDRAQMRGKMNAAKKGGLLALLLGAAWLLDWFESFAKGIGKALSGPLKAGWKAFKKILKGAWKGIRGFLKAGWKGLKGAWKAGLKAVKGVFRGLAKAVKSGFRGLKGAWNKAWQGIKNSKAWKGLTGALAKGVSAIKGIFQSLGARIKNALKSVGGAIAKALGIGTAKGAAAGAAQGGGRAMAQAGRGGGRSLLSRIGSGIKSVGKAAWGGVKAVAGGVGKGVKAVVGMPLKLAKSGLGKAVGKYIGKGGKAVVGFLGGVGRRLPIIGPAIEALFAHHDIRDMRDKHMQDPQKYTAEQMHQDAGKRGIEGITATVGSGAGAFIGNALGTVVPFVGNFIGTILGAMGGDALGRFAGSLLADHVIPKSATKDIGQWIIGNTPLGKGGGIVPGMGGKNTFYSGPQATPMAKGGIVTSPTLALIGEAGPEAVVPLGGGNNEGLVLLRQIRTGIHKLVRMGGMGGGGLGAGEAAAIAAQAANIAGGQQDQNIVDNPPFPGGAQASGRSTYQESALSLNVPPYFGN